ncbi:TPA: thymidine kinase, partial [Enterococcus faecium]|nr:thymidine kinase [Enterococcus faecium]
MAQLFYRYGTMNSGKSIELLKVAHNYEEQGKRVIIMTSAIDTRSGFGKVESRIGVSKPAIAITSEMDVYGELVEIIDQYGKVDCILVDE